MDDRSITAAADVSSIRVHDVAGDSCELGNPIDRTDPPLLQWEKETDGIFGILLSAGLGLNLDEHRKTIEALEPKLYNEFSYYEKWAVALVRLCCGRQ